MGMVSLTRWQVSITRVLAGGFNEAKSKKWSTYETQFDTWSVGYFSKPTSRGNGGARDGDSSPDLLKN